MQGTIISDETANSRRYAWYVVAMLWFIAFFNYADRVALSSVLPIIQKEFELNDIQLGQLSSAFAVVYGLAAPLAGLLVDRMSRKTAVLAGLHVWSVICMATAGSLNFVHLYIFRALEGLGESIYFPASMSMVSDYHGKATRSRAMSLHQTSVYMGTIAGGFFAGLIGQYYGWRWSFILFGGLGVVLGVVLHFILREPARGQAERAELGVTEVPPDSKRSSMENIRSVWSTPTAVILMGAFLCANYVAVIPLTWMPKYLYDKYEMNLAVAGLGATLFIQLASMFAAPLGGFLADKLRAMTPRGRMMVQAIGVLGGVPFVALCGFTDSIYVALGCLTMWGFFKGLYDANIFAALYDVVRPEARGVAAGFMNTIGWLGGGATAPIIVGYFSTQYGLGYSIGMNAFIGYVAAFILLMVGILFTVKHDSDRLQAILLAEGR